MTRTLRLRLTAGCLALITLAAAPPLYAAEQAPFDDAELRVKLGGYRVVRLAAIDGVWQPVIRSRPSYKHVDFGYVTQSKGDADNLELTYMLVLDGGERDRGHSTTTVKLARQADGTYAGTFDETAGTETAQGDAVGWLEPEPVYHNPDHKPHGPAEHPRLMLRPADVPALREKLKTPLGQAFYDKAKDAKDPVVQGVLYHATGNEAHALEALRIIQGYADIDGQSAQSGDFGHQLVRTVTTLDLCYDAWPEDYRRALLDEIKARLPKRQHNLILGHANYNQVSNYYGPAFGSAAIAALVLHKRKGPAPVEPAKPLCVRYDDCKVPALTGYEPPAGVPLVPLKPNELPSDWIFAGGLKPKPGRDPMAPLGGVEQARPTLGDEITDGARTASFQPVSREKDRGYYEWLGNRVIDVTNAIGKVYHSQSYFYTVVRNDTPGWYQFLIGTDHERSWTYLNGVLIEEGHLVQLEKGLYTIMVKVNIGQTEPWGREMLAVRFEPVTDGKIKKNTIDEVNAEIRTKYEQAHAFWQVEMGEWKARDGEDLACLRMYHKGREQMFQHLRFGIGDGGFQAEVSHYGNIAARYPLVYATYHREALGRDVSNHPDASHVLPRQMMQASLRGSRPVTLKLGVVPNFETGWMSTHFPLVPGQYKPYVLWAWAKLLGIDPVAGEQIDAAVADAMTASINGATLAHTFVNYPLDTEPVHPDEGMPKTWAADTLGLYIFRNGFDGGDEFIAQVFTKNIPIRAWSHPNAGTFRLWGLGHAWTGGSGDRSAYRPEENIVLLPDNVTLESASGRIADRQTRPDGSGSLLIDMSDVYTAAKEKEVKPKDEQALEGLGDLMGGVDEEDTMGLGDEIGEMKVTQSVTDYYREKDRAAQRKQLPKLYGSWGERRDDVDYKSHIDGERAIAFDYSGKSGAPCMMVVADTIRGGQLKQWLWHLPNNDEIKAQAKGNTFTLRYPDATLHGTIVSPANIEAEFHDDETMYFIYAGGSQKGQTIERKYDFVAAETTAEDATFFVIVTVQRTEPPAVAVTGEGDKAVARVGGRTVRLDGTRIVIE